MNRSYVPIIDGLRALAVILVLLFHLKIPGFKGGFIGVDIFFVISGYLITSIYFPQFKKNKSFDFINYFKKRIFRLLPALIFVIFLTLIVSYFLLSPTDLIEISKSSIYSSLFLSNIFFFSESSYWSNLNEYKILIHTWSLGIEMSFYLLFPIVLSILARLNNYQKIFFFLTIIVLSFTIIVFLISKGPTIESTVFKGFFYGKEVSDILFYLIPFRFFEFIFGIMLFFIPKVKINESKKKFFFISGIFLIFFSLYIISPQNKFQNIIVSLALIGTSLIIYFKDVKIINIIFENKISIFIGLISYSLYLVHWPVISFFKYIFIEEIGTYIKLIIIILTFIISLFIYRYIEIPFRNKNFKFRSIYILITIFIIVIFSSQIQLNDGFNKRLNIEQKEILSKISLLKENCERINSTVYKLKYKICLDGNESESKIILLGDSNATTWFLIGKKIAEKLNYSIVNYRRICDSFPKVSIENCYEINPKSEILIIGNLWYTWQSKEENIKTDVLRYINNINNINKNDNFKEIKKIIIFGQIPALETNNLNLSSCLLRPKVFFDHNNCEKKYSFVGNNNNLKKYKEVNMYLKKYGEEIISKNFDFLFIDPIKSLCNESGCIQYKDQELFYLNNNHLSNAAVDYVFEDNKKLIFSFLD